MTATATGSPVDAALARCYAHCQRVARAHYENFPVASVLLPPAMRPHVAAVYAFARAADDFADEGHAAPDERLARLETWRHALHGCVRDHHSVDGSDALVFRALGHTIRAHELPLSLFDDLLSAFAQDVTVHRYATWAEVLDYCRRSANPVGRLVLRLAGVVDKRADGWSDHVCTALQLANFWQDLGIDWDRGRLYLPAEALDRFGARESALEAAVRSRVLPVEWRRAVADAVDRTDAMFQDGRPVCDSVDGRLRWELRATWLGGRAILAKLRRGGCDPLAERPRLGASDVPALLWRALFWRRRAESIE